MYQDKYSALNRTQVCQYLNECYKKEFVDRHLYHHTVKAVAKSVKLPEEDVLYICLDLIKARFLIRYGTIGDIRETGFYIYEFIPPNLVEDAMSLDRWIDIKSCRV